MKNPRAALPVIPAVLAAGLLGLVPSPTGAQTPAPSASPTPSSASSEASTTTCADCHAEIVSAFAANPHARPEKGKKTDPLDVCAICHGDGTKHMEEGGDKSFIQLPRGAAGSQDCLSCHEDSAGRAAFSKGGTDSFAKGTQDSFSHSVHANSAAVNCLTCHSMHKPAPKSTSLIAKPPGELCATCHTTQAASFVAKPYAHRLNRGGMTCLDCHSPHARPGQVVKMTTQAELPCLNCHAEKRGPFVFQHVTGSGGDCLSCHEAHGSSNPNMLQWARVEQLCLSCHSQTGGPRTFGSQPPSFHDLTQARYRNCTTCHVAVHGSNLSPTLLK